MINIGIRAHDLNGAPFSNPSDLVKELNKCGIDSLQLVFKKAFKDFNLEEDILLNVSKVFKENGIKVKMVGAYFNMVHPDESKQEAGYEYFKWCLNHANIFDCNIVGSETGSLNGDEWTYNPLNQTSETFNKVVKVVNSLNNYSEIAKPVIEGAYAHTVYKPELMKELIDETGIDNVTVDIFNYLHIGNFEQRKEIFDTCLNLFKDKIRIFHIKDFIVSNGSLIQVPIGKGLMDYPYIIKRIKEEIKHDVTLILEEVTGENIKPSVEYLREILSK